MSYDAELLCRVAQEMGLAVFSHKDVVNVEELSLSIIVHCSNHGIDSVHQIPRSILDADDPVKFAQIYRVETALFQSEREASLAMMKQMGLDAWRRELKAQYYLLSA